MKKIKKEVKKDDNKEALIAAQKILQESQMIKIKKFEAKYKALCQEFELEIRFRTELVIVPINR